MRSRRRQCATARRKLHGVKLKEALEGGKLHVGCCGWCERRERYFQQFRVIELQDPFYQPPSTELASKWRQAAPEGFIFTLKAWQLITHPASSPTYRRLKQPIPADRAKAYGSFQPTPEVQQAWQTTAAVARALNAAAIVFQCPASFKPEPSNVRNLRSFFKAVERENRLFCWEPRGSWEPELVRELCQELDLIHCVDPFVTQPVYGQACYFRLHGRGGYNYQYQQDELLELVRRCWQLLETGHEPIYVMFNNVYMRDDAQRFLKLLRETA